MPHRLYGHVDAAENYSVGRWLEDVAPALREVRAAGSVPILVGGTGLYFKALTQGLSAVPPIPAEIRAAVRARMEAEGPAALHAELAARDPASTAQARATAPGSRARWRCWRRPGARSANGTARACRRCSRRQAP